MSRWRGRKSHDKPGSSGGGGGVSTSDPRLSDARTPTAHASTHAPAASDDLTSALSATAPPVALGTAAAGTGTGFERQGHVHPTTGLATSTHAATHQPGGTDPTLLYVAPASNQVATASSTVLANDTGMVLALAASSTYMLDALIVYDGPATGDFKIQFNGPTGATADLHVSAYNASLGVTHPVIAIATSLIVGAAAVGTKVGARVTGRVVVSTTAGNLQMQIAQGTADAGVTTRHTGSFIALRKVA